MCDHCHRGPRLSRRRFLQRGGAAAVTGLLAACGRRSEPSPTATTPTEENAVMPNERPALAGQVAAVEENGPSQITLAAPVGERALPLEPSMGIFDASGARVSREGLRAGSSVAVWLTGEAVTALQLLPPMAEPVTIPDDVAQPAATGVTRPFGPLRMITREGWGAAAAPQYVAGGESGPFDAEGNPAGWLVYPEPLAGWLKTVIVHHSALEFYQGPQAIQRLHMGQRGWADVGYHFLVDGLGQLYEGRAFNVRGAHTGGFNTGSVGVCLLGNFDVVRPATAQLETLRTLADHLREAYTVTHLAGHRDFQPEATSCPGAALEPLLPELAAEVGLSFGTAGYSPPEWS
ncbi:MAG: N-acetylmuramoyl-L-alanine amidase [Candidatus Promineifilaceae bacterium]|nr:N-acetylmuramoyl-L-alanine amidase [Candidatus Promineifilaceae bacterium]